MLSETGEFVVTSSGIYSMINWAGSSLVNVISTLCVILGFGNGYIVIVYSYYKINQRLGQSLSKMLELLSDTLSEGFSRSRNKSALRDIVDENLERQRRLLRRSLLIIVTYFIIWLPYSLLLLYEFFGKQPVPGLFDAVASVLVTLNPIMNFFIFSRTNNAYAQALSSLFNKLVVRRSVTMSSTRTL
jgi:hypothetical protein